MSQTILESGDLDVDLQGQIGLQNSRVFVLTVKNLIVWNFIFQLELFIEHLNILDGFEKW